MTVAVSVTCLQVAFIIDLITNIFNYSTGKKGQAMVACGNDLTQLLLGT